MRVVLLGGGGYVGTEFASQIAERQWEVVSIGRRDVNLYDAGELGRRLRELGPDALINCAGYTGKPNVDACEKDKANCLAGNAVLPGVIAEACAEVNVPWGHVSSGCIFTGRRDDGGGFDESDPPNFSFRQNNCSFYSGTKALGEEILSGVPNCYIWRLRIPFSHVDSPRNYLSKVMRYARLLEAENSLSHLPEFVAAGLDCLERRLPCGIYNLTNPGSVTTREVAGWIQESGVSDKAFEFFQSEEEFMSRAAITPRSNCVLDSSKAIAAGLKLTDVPLAVKRSLAQWQAEPVTL